MPCVTLAWPRRKQACPTRAACWSPAMPAIGTLAPSSSASPAMPADGTMRGSTSAGTPNRSSSSASQRRPARPQSRVREALVASIACTSPRVRCQISHESTVPKASPAASPCSRRIQRSLVAEKYGLGTRPVRSRSRASGSSAHSAAVRPSCQTIAGCTARPVARSQTTVVSRWLVMPIASRSPAPDPGVGERRRGGGRDALPDLVRILLDPARLRIALADRNRPAANHRQVVVHDQAGRAARSLVDGEDHRASIAAARTGTRRLTASSARSGPATASPAARPGCRSGRCGRAPRWAGGTGCRSPRARGGTSRTCPGRRRRSRP